MSYRDTVIRTMNQSLDYTDLLTNGAMGLVGESGEVCELVKKRLFHNKPLDMDNLILELGDVRWYLELLCYCASTTIEEVERINIEKLNKRYPNGFNKEKK